MIALRSPYDVTTEKTVEKRVNKRRLAEEEGRRFRKAWKSASLGMSFGQRAAIATSCYGVGEDTAARILRQSVTEDGMFLQLYYVERNFFSTGSIGTTSFLCVGLMNSLLVLWSSSPYYQSSAWLHI